MLLLLTKLFMGSTTHFEEDKKELAIVEHRLSQLGVRLINSIEGGLVVMNSAELSLVSEYIEKNDQDPILLELKESVHKKKVMAFEQGKDGVWRYQGRLCVDSKGNLDDHLPHIKFAYNNSHHTSIQMAPYDALYGKRCRSHVRWFEVGKLG